LAGSALGLSCLSDRLLWPGVDFMKPCRPKI
jgi:hypothetical protein